MIDAGLRILSVQFTLMSQAEQSANECGPDFVFTSTSLLKVAKLAHKRRSIDSVMNTSSDFGQLNTGDVVLVDKNCFKQQSLLAMARRESLPFKATSDPLELSQILTELEKHEEAIELAIAFQVSPAYALATYLHRLQERSEDKDSHSAAMLDALSQYIDRVPARYLAEVSQYIIACESIQPLPRIL